MSTTTATVAERIAAAKGQVSLMAVQLDTASKRLQQIATTTLDLLAEDRALADRTPVGQPYTPSLSREHAPGGAYDSYVLALKNYIAARDLLDTLTGRLGESRLGWRIFTARRDRYTQVPPGALVQVIDRLVNDRSGHVHFVCLAPQSGLLTAFPDELSPLPTADTPETSA